MVKKVIAAVIAAALVALLGLYVVGAVVAQEPTPTPQAGPKTWGGAWGCAARGAWGCVARGAWCVSDAVAKLLGMTRQEILTERAGGKTLAEIAKEKGISEQQLIDAMLAEQQAAIEQAVKDGRITQAQADWLLARAKALAPFELSNPFAPRGGRAGLSGDKEGDWRHGMPGGRGPWKGKGATPTPGASS